MLTWGINGFENGNEDSLVVLQSDDIAGVSFDHDTGGESPGQRSLKIGKYKRYVVSGEFEIFVDGSDDVSVVVFLPPKPERDSVDETPEEERIVGFADTFVKSVFDPVFNVIEINKSGIYGANVVR